MPSVSFDFACGLLCGVMLTVLVFVLKAHLGRNSETRIEGTSRAWRRWLLPAAVGLLTFLSAELFWLWHDIRC